MDARPATAASVLPTSVEILESMEEAYYALDRGWTFLYVNHSAERFWGKSREELVGKRIVDVFPRFANSEPYKIHERAFASGEPLHVEVVSTATDHPVELHLYPIRGNLSVFFRDISARRKLEQEMRERSEILDLAERSAGIGVWDLDLATNVLRGTPEFFRIMGLPFEPEGVPIEVTRSLRHPDDRERVIHGYRQAIADGADTYEIEYRIIRPDGQLRWIFGRGRVIRDAQGRPVRYGGVDIDVTERRKGEEAVDRLARIVESSDDAIIGKDLNGVIQSWNRGAQKLFGYAAEEIVGRPMTTLMPEESQDEEPAILERIRRGETIDHYQTIRKRKDGSLVDISLTVSPIRNSAGRIVGASNISRDITLQKRAEERQRLLLREMQHRVKNLFALAGAVVALTARHATSTEAMAAAIRERLAALDRAHATTLPVAGEDIQTRPATTLMQLLATIVSPHQDEMAADRIMLSGPEVNVAGGAVASLALLFHEIATNAAKYGALSNAEGRVRANWSVEDGRLRFMWMEEGGPAVDGEPQSEGFGSRLSKATVTGQLGGEIERRWSPGGLTVRVTVPVESLEQ
ncbi:MAG TPA: PAS domain S-box protein [Bauldia sp.]|nr:PAS domain S-box protein [Bauldia sp.]